VLPEVLDSAGFDLVALGHIHRPQQIQSCHNAFYSGAANAMNFNDEGQPRGFYIHDTDNGSHTFYQTPYREFLTIRLDSNEVELYNANGSLSVNKCIPAKDKIVRVLYSCTEDQNKALNRAQMEHDLIDAFGAYWVAEISPEKVTIGTIKDEFSEKTDPEQNLIRYLDEKGTPEADVGEIVATARPIIATALADSVTAQYTGAFVPVSIEVKNYRNYVEESFDFSDISFCTINGRNGAGKSSLFMDAILDCLFEEPREGDLTGWIRADESAHSGSITFTFSIGEHTFRVVRTRTKSGKATINLSELVNGEWQNRSCEKIKDTQEAIINVLGMDSLTFRSCALIMQDQYGLFLQASKEDRMTILSNILGLGLYGNMEQIARNYASDENRQIAQRKTVIATLSQELSSADELQMEFAEVFNAIETKQNDLAEITSRKDNLATKLSAKQEAAQKAKSLRESILALSDKKSDLTRNIESQNALVEESDKLLGQEKIIREQAAKFEQLTGEEKRLSEERSAVSATLDAASDVFHQIESAKSSAASFAEQKQSVQRNIDQLNGQITRASSFSNHKNELDLIHSKISEMEKKETAYNQIMDRYHSVFETFSKEKSEFDIEAADRKRRIEAYQSKAKMLENSHCIDAEHATCLFLSDAKAAKAALKNLIPESTKWKEAQLAALEVKKNEMESLKKQASDIGYQSSMLPGLRSQVSELQPKVDEFGKINIYRDMLKQNTDNLLSICSNLEDAQKRAANLEEKAAKLAVLRDKLTSLDDQINNVKTDIIITQVWVDKRDSLPLASERKTNALQRISEFNTEISGIDEKIHSLQIDYEKYFKAQEGIETIQQQLDETVKAAQNIQTAINTLHTKMGGLKAQLAQIEERKVEIRQKQDEVNNLVHKATIYETLKSAFSQDGIPHNIIRSMLPMLTTTANSILGQMTGGKMGMEFITDKVLKSNSKKEVATLDIIIEEYGKDSLPYLSKSGGEKVKASLSAILALAEIKSSQAGIQLGMLFIDEPPFLDADGVQAYCDALETIQHRYSKLKVMAVTHDPIMKARFPQSIDVIKTDSGSKVIIE
jgi:exonuclease SbcC